MAKFSKKGWGSDPNYDNFSSGGLERHVDKSRPIEELQVRLEDFKKGVNYHFHELLPDVAGNRRTRPDAAGNRKTRLGAGKPPDAAGCRRI
jgi:hypothetical protein